jgi:mannitol-specific phosphotransferase system IIBC component
MRRAAVIGAIAAIWSIAAVVAGLLAWKTAVGPVVIVLSRREAHGVHLGDLASVAVAAAWALLLTVVVLDVDRRLRHRRRPR